MAESASVPGAGRRRRLQPIRSKLQLGGIEGIAGLHVARTQAGSKPADALFGRAMRK